jgi:hypothetical protein
MSDFQEALPRPNQLHCCAERHLWRHGLALAIYQKIGVLTAGGKRSYHTDTARMALFFDANKAYVRRAFAALAHAGFLVIENGSESGPKAFKRMRAVKTRRWISHDDWAKANPGKCVCVDENLMPWSGDVDPLCGQLWAALDGKMRMYEALLKHARGSGRADKEIVAALSANWRAAMERKARKDFNRVSAKAVFFDTIKELSNAPVAVAGATCR